MRLFYAVGLVFVSSGVYAMETNQDASSNLFTRIQNQSMTSDDVTKLQSKLYNKKTDLMAIPTCKMASRAQWLEVMRQGSSNQEQCILKELECDTLDHHMQLLLMAFFQKNHEGFKAIISNFSGLKERKEYQALIPLIRNKIIFDTEYKKVEWEQILENYSPEGSH